MTDASPSASATATVPAERPYSPGLEGVVAAETALGYVDGERGRLLYRGYRIGDLVEHGTYPAVANLLWTGEWEPDAPPADGARPGRRDDRAPGAAARAPSRWTRCGPRSRRGARRRTLDWPPTPSRPAR